MSNKIVNVQAPLCPECGNSIEVKLSNISNNEKKIECPKCFAKLIAYSGWENLFAGNEESPNHPDPKILLRFIDPKAKRKK
ncbi:MAG: hypothetical protein H6622_13980 [Halobacteriovoraceae bacterium]|nr:hypothetical protein [Halobacteriovoraceae bacterium]